MSVERIFIRSKGKRVPINIEDICYCEANGAKTIFYFQDGSKVEVSKTLKYFETIFDPEFFIRVHHKFMVNSSHIKEILDHKQPIIVLITGKEITVSSRQVTAFNKFLK